ncbi:potassium-transporting ATPase subunit KdpC [Pragia fontium]|uniref:Potassium-transporting ATPase KdpC subunit n=1 Tax=Pragia fontium DSM 5563 = ATCC 49100 TaxID=1122977 RepID=A0AAJ5BGP5_9GAMM|nr:potassium-transporting ATPase subunit KdpC [Pragia fontium]SFC58661.1 K+-transporting ATPase ATPase C chain [Pragia fontium DSM 5563 = ATCC 49100]VEJ56676.1 potassium-transporting ATPase subunit C [Pragia fontium]
MNYLRPSIVLLILLTLITGVIYPLAVTGLAQAFLPGKAQGSLIMQQDNVVGSQLIGQNFTRADYFHGRPSVTAQMPYNALASGGSNLSSNNPVLKQRIEADVQHLRAENPNATGAVPLELVTASASGLDPHISPDGAIYQAERVAAARHLPLETVRQLIEQNTQQPADILGAPVVNVLMLNLALDSETQSRK